MELPTIPSEISNLITGNPLASVLGAGVIGAGVTLGASAIIKKSRSKSRKKRESKKSKARSVRKRGHSRKLKFGSKAYRKKYLGKRRRKKSHYHVTKRTSHKKIRYTKNNQPYVILAKGRARFIKKSSASRSRKMKGGRY